MREFTASEPIEIEDGGALAINLEAMLGPDARLGDLGWRMDNLYWVVNKDAKPVPFLRNEQQRDLIDNLWYRNLVLKARQLGFCLDPDTRVLTADLLWVRVSDLRVGDEVVACDEEPDRPGRGSARRMRTAVVEASARRVEKVYRMTFDDGRSVVCTGQHRWLTRKAGPDTAWRRIEDGKRRIAVGTKVRWVTKPWGESSVEDGWFGGMLDGEGSMAKDCHTAGVNVSQRPGPVWDRLVRYASDRGYSACIEGDAAVRASKHGRTPVPKLAFGRMDELFRLIGQTRPTRFIGRRWWEGRELPGKRSGIGWATVVSIDPLPEQEVVDIQTSTGTFIAEGFVSHNSTLMQILQLDQALFNRDFTGVTIADTLPNAGKLFKKVEFAYEHLADLLKAMFPIFKKNQGSEIVIGHVDEDGKLHPSTISVGVSARGGTVQLLHVSELGKIALKWPQRAEEIKTGAFEAVPQDGCIVVESTAEGAFGLFYELCEPAIKRREKGQPETKLDWRLHFYPWFECKDYRLSPEDAALVEIPPTLQVYFRKLEAELKIKLDPLQRAWYAKKAETQGKKMKQEYPSTPKEAFEQAIEGAVYGEQAWNPSDTFAQTRSGSPCVGAGAGVHQDHAARKAHRLKPDSIGAQECAMCLPT